jgi:hypothetical protein
MRLVRKEATGGSWGITLSSRGDENPSFILLWLGSVVYTFYFDWFFLKPYKYTWTYKGKKHEDMIAAKELSFVVHYGQECGYVSFRYGADKDFLMADDRKRENVKHIPTILKMWSIPWRHSTFRKHILLNIDGSEFVEIKNHRGMLNEDECNNPWDYPGHERIKFTFRDGYDNEIITAVVYREKRVWTKGIGWMKWLKYFTKPIVSDSIDLNFDKEVGEKKGSWKGGILGQSASVIGNEGTLGSCIRFCEENGHHFITFVRGVDGEIVYKNRVVPARHFDHESNASEQNNKASE